MPSAPAAQPFSALALGSDLTRGQDDARFVAPPPSDGGTGRPVALSWRFLLPLAVGVLVLGVLAGVLWVRVFHAPEVDGPTIVEASQSAGAEVRTPQETVGGYLSALQAGDIQKALAYGPRSGEGSEALLMPAAYASMASDARPSDIRVVTDDPLASEVDVVYTLDGRDVSTSLRVTRLDNGSYEMAATTVTIQLQVVGGDRLPVFVNGVEVDHRLPLEVVPGVWSPGTGLPLIAFPASSAITVLSLAETQTAVFPVNPELTPGGRSAFLDAAKVSLARCLESVELAPSRCPNAVVAPEAVAPGSVSWSLADGTNAWRRFTPALSATDQSVAVATVPLTLRVSMDYADGSSSGDTIVAVTVVVTATMLGEDADAVSVVWEG